MFTKKSKSLIVSSVLLVFTLVLVACQPMIVSTEEENRQRVIDAWAANNTAQGEQYLRDQRVLDAWAANYSAQGEQYLQDQKTIDAWDTHYAELAKIYRESLAKSVDAYVPEVSITRTRLANGNYMTVYEIKSAGPGWVVFHADENGEPGAILRYVYIEGGTSKLVNIETQGEVGTEARYVMLHEDKGTIGRFEFPGVDGPVLVDEEVVEEMCLCNY